MYPYLGTFIFPVYTYGVLLSLGFLGGILLAIRNCAYVNISSVDIIDLALWFMISSMVGARVLFILLYPSHFPTWISWLEFNKGGLVFFGGFIATVFTVCWFSWKRGLGLRDLGDLIAPSLATGQVLGRVGCFMNGCCYGRQTDSFVGLVFPNLHDSLHRHPTQLYEAAFLFMFLLLSHWAVRNRSRFPRLFPGAIWGAYGIGYGVFRFCIEFIRDDDRGGFFTAWHLSISQLIAMGAVAASLLWLAGCYRWACPPTDSTPGPH